MRAARLLLLSAALCTCTVPGLRELEAERARACDANHLCADGYSCVSGVCRAAAVGECEAEDTQFCGSSVGECVPGTQSCGGELTWGPCVGALGPVAEVCDGLDNDCNAQVDDGLQSSPLCALQQGVCAGKRRRCLSAALEAACVAASYGASYEAAETRCDGQDNDCDGQADEGLMVLCPLQQGVCAGAQAACTGSADAGCAASAYAARDARYELFESRCDGLDNDCDGLADDWALQNVSNTDGGSTRPAAVRLASGALLVLWEEGAGAGRRVTGRLVQADGTLGPLVNPSASAGLNTSHAPALAVDGNEAWAAWVEEGVPTQVKLAPLGADGRSTLPSGAAHGVALAQPTSVALAVDATVGRVLVAAVNGGAVELAAFTSSSTFADAGQLGTSTVGLGSGRAPSVAPAGNGQFWVAFETGAGASRCLVDGTQASLPRSCGAVAPNLTSPTVLPLSGASPYLAAVGAIAPADAGAGFRPRLFDCDAGACQDSAPRWDAALSSLASGLRFATLARNQPPAFGAYEEQSPAAGLYRLPGDGGAALRLAGALTGAHRPVPLMLSAGRGAVVFDTEGNSTAFPAGEIVLQRLCAP